MEWDFFISHASEDKDFARELKNALVSRGYKVWFDESIIKMGDSLSESIENGLINSKFGILILSHNFFQKLWTKKELNALFQKELQKRSKSILPITHDLTIDELRNYSLTLSDKLSYPSTIGTNNIIDKILLGSNLFETEIIKMPGDTPGEFYFGLPDGGYFVEIGDIVEAETALGLVIIGDMFMIMDRHAFEIEAPYKCRILKRLCEDCSFLEPGDDILLIEKIYD